MKLSKIDKLVFRARECSLNGDHAEALEIYERLTRRLGRHFGIWFEYGIAAAALLKFDLAEQAWQKACELAPQDAELLLQIGHQYKGARQPEKARLFYQRSAALNPQGANPIIGLAVLHEENNCLAEARELVLQCLAQFPRDEQALYVHALLDRREGKLAEAERQFRDLIASDLKHPYVPYASRYELANILERLGNVDEAMRFLGQAKDLVRALGDTKRLADTFHANAEVRLRLLRAAPKNMVRLWTEAYPADQTEAIARVAFLGGHPRSGTTLIEQILAAQNGIAAFDEPLTFGTVVHPHVKNMKKEHELTGAIRSALRKTYIQGLQNQPGANTEGKLLLDKNPSLTLFLPALLQLFPELRVIIALRDPRDVALSCYFVNIPITTANSTFLSFEGIAKHYQAMMETWLLVREWEGFEWLESRYEDTVADVEKEGKRVTSFLGLPWQEEQALFYESAKSSRIYSPTHNEVTKPIYRHSVARWRAYEKYLAPILPALEPFCQAFGYD